MSKTRWTGLAAAAALAIGLIAAWTLGPWKAGRQQAPAAAMAAPGKDKSEVVLDFLPSEVVTPQWRPMDAMVEFSGPLVAPGTAIVRAKVAGTLASLSVDEGSRVRAGQVMGRIQAQEAESRAQERVALLDSARASLAQAQRTHAQNESLAAQRFISQAALEASRAGLDTARAQAAAAEAALNTARLSLSDASVLAPISGTVARRHALPGEKVSPEQNLVTVVDIGKLELAGAVGMHEVSKLRTGMPVEVSVEGLPRPISGSIARIAPAAEPGSRSIGVVVVLPNPGEVMRGGQFAVAQVRLSEGTQRLTLPEAAVRSSSGQHHVWVLEGETLRRRVVLLGRRDAAQGRVEVREGLDERAMVLAAAFDNLKEGQRARRVAQRPSAAASAAGATVGVASSAASAASR